MDILEFNKQKEISIIEKFANNTVVAPEAIKTIIVKGHDVYTPQQIEKFLSDAKDRNLLDQAKEQIKDLLCVKVKENNILKSLFVSKEPSAIEKAFDENLSPIDLDIVKGGKAVAVGTVVVRKNGVKEMKTENGWKYMGRDKAGKSSSDDSLDKKIDEAIKESNIPNVQSNSGLKNIIKDALSTIKDFGYEKWEKETTLGKTAKEIVKKLSGKEKEYLGIKSIDALQKMSKEDLKKELSSLKEQRGEFNTEDGKKMFTKLSNKIKEIEGLLGEEKEPTAKQESKKDNTKFLENSVNRFSKYVNVGDEIGIGNTFGKNTGKKGKIVSLNDNGTVTVDIDGEKKDTPNFVPNVESLKKIISDSKDDMDKTIAQENLDKFYKEKKEFGEDIKADHDKKEDLKQIKEAFEFVNKKGSTYMDLDDDPDFSEPNYVSKRYSFSFSTRQNGNIGEEKIGEADWAEAQRLKKTIKEKFPNLKVDIQEVGEYVSLTVSTEEQKSETKKEQSENAYNGKSMLKVGTRLKAKDGKTYIVLEDNNGKFIKIKNEEHKKSSGYNIGRSVFEGAEVLDEVKKELGSDPISTKIKNSKKGDTIKDKKTGEVYKKVANDLWLDEYEGEWSDYGLAEELNKEK